MRINDYRVVSNGDRAGRLGTGIESAGYVRVVVSSSTRSTVRALIDLGEMERIEY